MSAHQAASIRKYRHLLMVTDQAQAGDIGHVQHPPSSASTPFEIEKGRTLLPVCLWCKPRLLAAPKRETRFSLAGRQIPDASDIDHLPFELRLSERQVVPAPGDGAMMRPPTCGTRTSFTGPFSRIWQAHPL